MKFLFYTDIHHGAGFRYGKLNEDGVNSRLLASLQIEDFITSLIDNHKIDYVFFLGDLVERSMFAYINDMVRQRIKGRLSKCPHYFLRGNHDRYFKGIDIYGDALNTLLEVIRVPAIIELKGLRIGFIPDGSDGDEDKILKNNKLDFLLVHRDILNADWGFIRSTKGLDSQRLSKQAHRVLCGHIHKPQILQKNVICLGSVVPTDLSESDGLSRGIYIWDSATDELELVEVPVPQLVKLEWNFDGNMKMLEQNLEKYKGHNVVLFLSGKKRDLLEVQENKKDLEKVEFENLTLILRGIDDEVKNSEVYQITEQARDLTLDERIRFYIEKMDSKGLDKKILLEKGFEILNEV